MKNINGQRGDAMVIVVILLAVALLGALGWIAYDKFLCNSPAEPEVAQTSETPKEDADPKEKTKEFCAEHEKICFAVPTDWQSSIDSAHVNYVDGVETDEVKFSYKDNTPAVYAQTGMTNLGGACESDEAMGRIHVVAKKRTAVDSKANKSSKAWAVSTVQESSDGKKFIPEIALTSKSEVIDNTEVGACTALFYINVMGKNIRYGDTLGVVRVVTSSYEAKQEEFTSLAKAKEYLNTPTAKQAFDIIASAHYK
jgi:hypothetical protein